jgi:hypothetical protein
MSEIRKNFEGLVTRPAVGVAGRHYYGCRCRACREPLAVLKDASEGALPLKLVGDSDMAVVCPACGAHAIYVIADMQAFQQK